MGWFDRMFDRRNPYPRHISENNTADERTRRLATVSESEQKAFKWLFEGYSEAWTTETLGLEKQDAKDLFIGIYRKLGVKSAREIVRYYAPREVCFIRLPGKARESNDEARPRE